MYDSKYKQELTDEELNSEIWKDIQGYEGLYKVSNLGRVKNRKGLIMSPELYHKGYYRVQLYNKGKRKHERINRLVALAFIPNPNNYPMVNHKDENKLNNKADNLEWCTHKYNCNYGTAIERSAKNRRKKVIMYDKQGNKLKDFKSLTIASSYLNKPHAHSHISDCCKGKRKSAYGYIWKYK